MASGTGMGSGSCGASRGSQRCSFFDLQGIGLGARQANGQVLAEMKGPVVPPAGFDRFDRKVGPMRELGSDQPTHESNIDADRVGVHA
jgi:hypothetical protein